MTPKLERELAQFRQEIAANVAGRTPERASDAEIAALEAGLAASARPRPESRPRHERHREPPGRAARQPQARAGHARAPRRGAPRHPPGPLRRGCGGECRPGGDHPPALLAR